MNEDPAFQVEDDNDRQHILLAASQHNISALRRLFHGPTVSPANVKDPDTGYTPLHSAIYACASDPEEGAHENEREQPSLNGGDPTASAEDSAEIEKATETVQYLLRNGAVWNVLDYQNETPGCVALRLKLTRLYNIMVDAGVRAEMLLNRLDEYEPLGDQDSEDEGAPEDDQGFKEVTEALSDVQVQPDSLQDHALSTSISTTEKDGINRSEHFTSSLDVAPDRTADEDQNGVAMSWKRDIMARNADELLPTEGLRVLNIGHGIGIIDMLFQEKKPSMHHIIEAYPQTPAKVREEGWDFKPGVTLHDGRWQDVVPQLIERGQLFDAVYFDTFGEDYKALRRFFSQYGSGILNDGGRFSFFNRFGADRQICYDVYAKVVEIDLLQCGFDIDWTTIKVSNAQSEATVSDSTDPSWRLEEYKLPVITFLN